MMEVKLQVDETQFADLVNKEINNLPQEKVHELILEGIRIYLQDSKVIENLFITNGHYSWQKEPSQYLRFLIAKDLPTDSFYEVRQEVIQTLKDNYDEILKKAFIELLVQGIFQANTFENSFRDTLLRLSHPDR